MPATSNTGNFGQQAIRWIAALTLALAAIAKMLATTEKGVDALPIWLIAPLELGLAVWLATRIASRQATLVASSLFAIFFVLGLRRLGQDHFHCGCYGNFTIGPLQSLFLTGSGAVALTQQFLCGPRPRSACSRHIGTCALVTFSIAFLTALGAALLNQPNAPTPDASLQSAARLVSTLDPQDRQMIALGEWRVIVVQHDCERCQGLLSQLADLGASNDGGRRGIVVAELPPYASEAERLALFPGARWVHVPEGVMPVCLPQLIELHDYGVTQAVCHQDAMSSFGGSL